MEKVRIGLIGAGNIANTHMISYGSVPNAEVVAICDIDVSKAERLAKKYGVEKYYCSMEEMMTLPGVGIVQAKKAIAYRQEQGGFRNVDEFVQLLGMKPHFAVKIFEMTGVSAPQNVAVQAPRMSDRGRRLDF